MRSVIKNRQIVEDHWQAVGDEEELPSGAVIVSLARWRHERASLLARGGPLEYVCPILSMSSRWSLICRD